MKKTTSMSRVEGLIVKGIAGFYYVKSGDEVYRCRARGVFKARDLKPAVGDRAVVEVMPGSDDSLITEILPRRNSFIRPFAANVDCFAIVAAAASPAPVLSVIDRFTVMAEKNGADIIVCINKCDLTGKKAEQNKALLREIYEPLYPVVMMGRGDDEGLGRLKELARGKSVALAGASGVGKSTILNRLIPHAGAETGDISAKSDRGRNTTRHTELFSVDDEGTLVFDTPGFTSFQVMDADEDELQHLYPEIESSLGGCRYYNCRHIAEPDCCIRDAVDEGRIHPSRYASYRAQMEEIRNSKQY